MPNHIPGSELPFEGERNFRELGGYPAADGRIVRYGLLYRGAATGALRSAADRQLLESLGLKLILDLRSSFEVQREPDFVPHGVQYRHLCALRHADGSEISFSPEDIGRLAQTVPDPQTEDAPLRGMYRQMLYGNAAYKALFEAMQQQAVPLLFHCTAGKDRTGVAAMLILLALGASEDTALEDYELTNRYREVYIQQTLRAHADKIAGDPGMEARIRAIQGVSRHLAEFVLQTIRRECGSTEAYLAQEYGLDAGRLAQLRAQYLQ